MSEHFDILAALEDRIRAFAAHAGTEAAGPSIELSPDVDFLDIDLTEFVYDEPLDLGPHGKVDPQKPSGIFGDQE